MLAFLLVWFVPRDSPSLHLDSVTRSHLMFAIFLDEFDCDPIVVAVVPPLASAPAPPPPSPSEQLPHPCCGACIFSRLSLSFSLSLSVCLIALSAASLSTLSLSLSLSLCVCVCMCLFPLLSQTELAALSHRTTCWRVSSCYAGSMLVLALLRGCILGFKICPKK